MNVKFFFRMAYFPQSPAVRTGFTVIPLRIADIGRQEGLELFSIN